jgi:preprotein translocase subunit SecF
MNFNFIKYSPVYYIVSAILIVASVACISMYGLKFGIDFEGGSNMEIQFSDSSHQMSKSSKRCRNSILAKSLFSQQEHRVRC